MSDFLKKKRFWIGLVLVMAFVPVFYFFAGNPFKVTDPNDPRFNIKQLRYADFIEYNNPSFTIAKIFEEYFPVGTSRSEVESVLVDGGVVAPGFSDLYEDRRNAIAHLDRLLAGKSATYFAIYYFTQPRSWLPFSLTPSGGVNLYGFYDDENKLLFMIVHNEFVHNPSQQNEGE